MDPEARVRSPSATPAGNDAVEVRGAVGSAPGRASPRPLPAPRGPMAEGDRFHTGDAGSNPAGSPRHHDGPVPHVVEGARGGRDEMGPVAQWQSADPRPRPRPPPRGPTDEGDRHVLRWSRVRVPPGPHPHPSTLQPARAGRTASVIPPPHPGAPGVPGRGRPIIRPWPRRIAAPEPWSRGPEAPLSSTLPAPRAEGRGLPGTPCGFEPRPAARSASRPPGRSRPVID